MKQNPDSLNAAALEAIRLLTIEEGKKEAIKSFEDLKTWWKNSDPDLGDMYQTDPSAKILLDTRDPEMAKNIKNLLESKEGKTYFVLVGAAHYVPDGSVLDYLEDYGYKIENLYD